MRGMVQGLSELAQMRIRLLGEGSLWMLAARLGMSKARLSRIESGQALIGPEVVKRYADALVEGTKLRPPYHRAGRAYWVTRLAWLRQAEAEAERQVYRRK